MKKLLGLALALFCATAHADWIGDFAPGTTAICGQFTTYNPSSGAPATLSGTPALAVYKIGDGVNSATESTIGLTHAEDVDARTGMNRVCIDTSADGTFYSAGAQFSVVITTGTVGGVSVVGSEVKSFSLNKVAALRPATAGRTLVVDAAGLADANMVKMGPTGSGTAQTARDIGASVLLSSGTGTGQVSLTSGVVAANVTQAGGSAISQSGGLLNANATQVAGNSLTTLTGAYPSLGIIDSGTAQAATSTTLQLRSAATFADSEIIGATCVITGGTTGVGQARTVTAYTGSTDTATVATWTTTPTGTITYACFGTAAGAAGSLTASDVWTYGTRTLTAATNITSSGGTIPITASRVDASVGAYQTGLTPLQPTVAGRTLDVTATGGAGIDWSNVENPTTTVNLSGTTISTGQTVGLTTAGVNSIWNEPQSGHTTAGTFGKYLDSAISGVSTGGVSAATIAAAVWDEALSGHVTAGTSGERLGRVPNAAAGASGGLFIAGSNAATSISGLTTNITGNLSGSIGSVGSGGITSSSFGSGAITSTAIATDAIGSTQFAASAATEIANATWAITMTEPTAKPTWASSTLKQLLEWQAAWSVNKITQTSTTKTLRNTGDSGNIATCSVSDNGTTFTQSACTP